MKYLISELDCDPQIGSSDSQTPLHYAALNGHLDIVKSLISQYNCNPRCSTNKGATPLHFACEKSPKYVINQSKCNPEHGSFTPLPSSASYGQLAVVKYLISELGCDPQIADSNGLTPLHYAALEGHIDIVKSLISQYNCNPHYCADIGNTPLHCACQNGHLEVAKYLITELGCNSQIGDNDGLTPLHYSALNPDVTVSHTLRIVFDSNYQLELKSCKIDIFKYLVSEQKCDVQYKDRDGLTPLHYACSSGQLDIVQYIHREKLSDLVHTTLSGDTPLHIACKFSQVEITEFLLSTGECKALCENAEGMTPLEISTSIEIRRLLENFCKGNYPLESIVKVFIVGAPLAGKSSLVQALKSNRGFASSLIGRFQRVKGVRQQTAGIDSLSFCSSDFGNVVMFDFAGQQEFYTNHAAFLQNSSSNTAGIFLLVVNISQCEDDISKDLQYWVSFIQECCAHSKTKPCVILVGSHADQLASGDVDQAFMLLKGFSQHSDNINNFYTLEGIVCLDCTRRASHELDLLYLYLQESCNSIRENAGSIDQRCYILHRYIRKTYTNAGVQGCTLENISKDLENNSYLLPSSPTELLPLFQTLHEKSQILLLENQGDIGDSWVIINIPALHETVVSSIFAPRDFPQHISPGSTGVVAKSRLCEAFSDLNTDMVIGFLEHFEFCHHLQSDWMKLSVLAEIPKEVTDDDYYLFPALVTSNHLSRDSYESSHCCGWLIRSRSPAEYQFFTVRFLHVLLLRLAFNFALPQDSAVPGNTEVEIPGLKRSCTMCKNGITWSDGNGVSALLEMKDLKTVILVMSSMKGREIHCVRLRTQLIKTILKAKSEFCPRVLVEEFIMDIGSGRELQVVEECLPSSTEYSIQYLSGRIAARGAQDPPDMSLVNPDGSKGKHISQLLYFEPYSLLTSKLIAQMFSDENSNHIVPDTMISQLAGSLYPCNNILVQVLLSQPVLLREKLVDEMDPDVLDCLAASSQLLRCVHILKAWVEQLGPDATCRRLRHELNKFSIFCGRNPLDLVCDTVSVCQCVSVTLCQCVSVLV